MEKPPFCGKARCFCGFSVGFLVKLAGFFGFCENLQKFSLPHNFSSLANTISASQIVLR